MKHILFVDDDLHQAQSIATSLIEILLGIGVNLVTITNAQKVLDGYIGPVGSSFIGAIVDLWMVDKESHDEDREMGVKLIRSLRSSYPKIPIVVFSAHLDDERSRSLEAIGNIKVIKKPASGREILEKFFTSDELNKGCLHD